MSRLTHKPLIARLAGLAAAIILAVGIVSISWQQVATHHPIPQAAWDALAEGIRSRNPHLWQARWPVLGIALLLVSGIGILLGEVLAAHRNVHPETGETDPAAPSARPAGIWIGLFITLALLRGLLYIAVIPPWESPDEYGHFEYVWLVSEYGPFVGPEAIPPDFQQRMLEITDQHDYWHQVGDERPPYYALAGGALRLIGNQDLVTGMYVGRVVSAILYAAAVGLTALTARRFFPQSLFLQVTPPAFILFLPMLGQIGTATGSAALGVLSSTLFLVSLIPVFRDGLTWRRAGGVLAALALALLSQKTTLFLIPTAALALPAYGWTQNVTLPRRIQATLAACAALLTIAGIALTLIPGRGAASWVEKTGACGPSRIEGAAYDGQAALRIGPCAGETVAQALPPEAIGKLVGQPVTLSGRIRGEEGPTVGQITIWDNEGATATALYAGETWQPFTLTRVLDPQARHAAVRLSWVSGEPALFDQLALASSETTNLLANGSAEESKPLLLDLLAGAGRRVWPPLKRVERLFMPTSWGPDAWREYLGRALFSFHSFWGNFGWLALPLPPTWYWAIELTCVLASVGAIRFIVKRPHRTWQHGYLFLLMASFFCLLTAQLFLPIVIHRGTLWLPQGRYLFPGAFAIAFLMPWGVRQLLPRRWERQATAIAVGIMAAFDLMCLAYLIMPHFYR